LTVSKFRILNDLTLQPVITFHINELSRPPSGQRLFLFTSFSPPPKPIFGRMGEFTKLILYPHDRSVKPEKMPNL